jgi:hypothetical protein
VGKAVCPSLTCGQALIDGSIIGIIKPMRTTRKILKQMRDEPANIRFSELRQVCESYFGEPRQQGSSHLIFKTPWPGDPRVNIQDANGKAKPYQVRQALRAIDKLAGKR